MISDKAIDFIICVNDEEQYNKMLVCLYDLVIPEGYEVNIITINNAESMTKGYNEGIRLSKAKYKIYVHQDTYIINKNFLIDMLNIFKDEKIAMFGSIGSEELKSNAVWWESEKKVGKVFESSTGSMRILNFDKDKEYETVDVEAIDGLVMVTQYDIPWRDDIFDGWHFYDASQCKEFIKRGYRVVVPYQDEPWYMHDCGIVNTKEYEKFRQVFLKEYF